MALRLGVKAYENLPQPGWREFPGYSQEDITTPLLIWINHALVSNAVLSPDDEQKRRVEERIERAFVHPAPDEGPSARRQGELREIALDWTLEEARKHAPRAQDWPRFDALIRNGGMIKGGKFPGWWPLFRAFLAEEIKSDEKVQRILAEQGIARILELQVNLAVAVADLQIGYEQAFGHMRDALDELRAACHDIQGSSGRIEAAVILLERVLDSVLPSLSRIEQGVGRIEARQKATDQLRLVKAKPLDDEAIGEGFQRFVYVNRWIDLIGREAERGALDEFAAASRDFSFGLLHGAGGVGKSRLALDACDRLAARWHTGMLKRNKRPAHGWDVWQPDMPTLAVVDYASGRIEDVAELIVGLSGRGLDHPVRLLLLDRQGGLAASLSDSGDRSSRAFGWADRLVDRIGAAPSPDVLRSFAFERQLTSLPAPAALMTAVFQKKGVSPPDSSLLLAALKKIDPSCSPLFAMLVADAMADGVALQDADRYRFLVRVFERGPELQAAVPHDVSEISKNLLALATLTRGFEGSHLIDALTFAERRGVDVSRFQAPHGDWNAVFEAAGRLSGHFVPGGIDGLEPDLLGEAFVLNRVDSDLGFNATLLADGLRELSWLVSRPGEHGYLRTAEMMSLCANDFIERWLDSRLAHVPSVNTTAAKDWAAIFVDVCVPRDANFDLKLIQRAFRRLAEFAERDDAPEAVRAERAKAAFNLCYDISESGDLDGARAFYEAELREPAERDDAPEAVRAAAKRARDLFR